MSVILRSCSTFRLCRPVHRHATSLIHHQLRWKNHYQPISIIPSRNISFYRPTCSPAPPTPQPPKTVTATKENIYTLPNLLTVSRILACPVLGWSILEGQFELATSLLVYAGLTDLVSLLLRFCAQVLEAEQSVQGRWISGASIQHELRPWNNSRSSCGQDTDDDVDCDVGDEGVVAQCVLLHLHVFHVLTTVNKVPLAVIILGRDGLLILSALWIRYTTLPHPVSSCYSRMA